MDDITSFIDQYGITTGILILILINLWRYVIPGVIEFWEQRLADRQEHLQQAERIEWQIKQSERFSLLHHEATRDERYAILTDRIYDQLDQSNEFLRGSISIKLEELTARLQILESRLSLLVQVIETIYERNNPSDEGTRNTTSTHDI